MNERMDKVRSRVGRNNERRVETLMNVPWATEEPMAMQARMDKISSHSAPGKLLMDSAFARSRERDNFVW